MRDRGLADAICCKISLCDHHQYGDRLESDVATFLGHAVPNASPEMMFTEMQIRSLRHFAKRDNLHSPDDLQAMVLLVALLDEYQQRKKRLPRGLK